MADYYSLISRAVAALDTTNFEARRAIYNHARAAQSEQLHNRPFNKKDFDHERLMLEDAISRVEIEVTGGRHIEDSLTCCAFGTRRGSHRNNRDSRLRSGKG